jgi:hypothetical protein
MKNMEKVLLPELTVKRYCMLIRTVPDRRATRTYILRDDNSILREQCI